METRSWPIAGFWFLIICRNVLVTDINQWHQPVTLFHAEAKSFKYPKQFSLAWHSRHLGPTSFQIQRDICSWRTAEKMHCMITTSSFLHSDSTLHQGATSQTPVNNRIGTLLTHQSIFFSYDLKSKRYVIIVSNKIIPCVTSYNVCTWFHYWIVTWSNMQY